MKLILTETETHEEIYAKTTQTDLKHLVTETFVASPE